MYAACSLLLAPAALPNAITHILLQKQAEARVRLLRYVNEVLHRTVISMAAWLNRWVPWARCDVPWARCDVPWARCIAGSSGRDSPPERGARGPYPQTHCG